MFVLSLCRVKVQSLLFRVSCTVGDQEQSYEIPLNPPSIVRENGIVGHFDVVP